MAPENELLQRLSRLERQARWVGVGSVLAVTWAGVLSLLLAAVLLDAGLHLTGSARAAVLVLALSVLGLAAVGAVRRLTRRPDLAGIARHIELHYPQLRDRLLSTVEWLEQPFAAPTDHRAALRRAVIARTISEVQELPFERLVRRRFLWGSLVLAGAASALLLSIVSCQPSLSQIAWERWSRPYAHRTWTRIEDESSSHVVPGRPFALRVRLTGMAPDQVRVTYTAGGAERVREIPVSRTPEGAVAALELAISDSDAFRYRIQANDAMLEREVTAASPPRLLDSSFEIELGFPEYTGLPPRRLAGGGDLELIRGTRVQIHGRTDMPLERTTFEVRRATDSGPRVVLGRETIGLVASQEFSVAIDTAELPSGTVSCHLRLQGVNGLADSRQFAMRLEDDPAPVVGWGLPDRASEPMVLIRGKPARLPLAAADERFGLRRIVVLKTHADETPAALLGRVAASSVLSGLSLPLGNYPAFDADLAGRVETHDLEVLWRSGLVAGAVGPIRPLALTPLLNGSTPVVWVMMVDPAAAGSPVVRVQALAEDNRQPQPGVTWTVPLEVQVVSQTEFQRLVARRSQQIQEHLVELESSLTKLGREIEEARRGTFSPAETAARLAELHRQLRQVAKFLSDPQSRLNLDRAALRRLLSPNAGVALDAEERERAMQRHLAVWRRRFLDSLADALPVTPGHSLERAARTAEQAAAELHDLVEDHRRRLAAEAPLTELRALVESQRELLAATRGEADSSLLRQRQSDLASEFAELLHLWSGGRRGPGPGPVLAAEAGRSDLAGVFRDAEEALHAGDRASALVFQSRIAEGLERLQRKLLDELWVEERTRREDYGDRDVRLVRLAMARGNVRLDSYRGLRQALEQQAQQLREIENETRHEGLRSRRSVLGLVRLEDEASSLARHAGALAEDSPAVLACHSALADELETLRAIVSELVLRATPGIGAAPELEEETRTWQAYHAAHDSAADRLEVLIEVVRAELARLQGEWRDLVLEAVRRFESLSHTPFASADVHSDTADAGTGSHWDQMPPELRRELEAYARDRFLPGYEDECARYYRAISRRKAEHD